MTDILWANALPEDRVEHISISPDDDPRVLIVALFFRAELFGVDASGAVSGADRGLRLARAAIATSPTLMGWSVRLDDRGDLAVAPEND